MTDFATKMLPEGIDVLAPDGSEVRVLLAMTGGSMAHFRLSAGQISRAVRHRSVAEIWFVLSGTGEMWRSDTLSDGRGAQIVPLSPGLCLTIPPGTDFQFRADPGGPLAAVAITMPPWPGEHEAVFVTGPWPRPKAP